MEHVQQVPKEVSQDSVSFVHNEGYYDGGDIFQLKAVVLFLFN